MKPFIVAVAAALIALPAAADKYGLDELDRDPGSSWGALALVIALFAYLYFKEK